MLPDATTSDSYSSPFPPLVPSLPTHPGLARTVLLYVRLYTKHDFLISPLRFILIANWLLCGVPEELASRFVARSVLEARHSCLAWYVFERTLQTVSVLQTRPVNRLGCHYGDIALFQHLHPMILRSTLRLPCFTNTSILSTSRVQYESQFLNPH